MNSSLTRVLAVAFAVLFLATAAFASCAQPANPIEAENCLTGTPSSQWDITGAGDSSIQGFATDISVNVGQTVSFKISTPATSYHLDIYRMGYYQGNGARKVATVTPSAQLPQTQPNCLTQSATGLYDCGNWAVSASWNVPSTAVSGIYFAHLIRNDTGGDSHIVFIVRNDASSSDILFKTSDTAWQAYNDYGGVNFYTGGPGPQGGAFKISYNRPFHTRVYEFYSWVFNAEYPMVRFLEANGYDVSYLSSLDADRFGSLILQHKSLLSVGHDEYWSGTERTNVEAARAAGVHLAFITGNGIFWKTRWESSIDGSNTPNRTLVCYKETHANKVTDPLDPPTWTGTWRDPRFSPPADGGRPENALSGTIFFINGPGPVEEIKVPQADGKMRFWRGTAVANLGSGQTYSTSINALGYEWDMDVDNGFRPAGLFDMSTATYSITSNFLLDYGSTYGAGTAIHHLTMYRYLSNGHSSLVFGSGTSQWPWGLDGNHDGGTTTPDINLKQATVNLFADMGIQPVSLQPGLLPATASTDTIPPTSTITSPANGATFASGTTVTIQGTAADTGGVVGGVEVSADNGATWHPAAGRASWTYSWKTSGNTTAVILSRAADDSGNLETPSAGVTVTVGSGSQTCPCTIWPGSSAPKTADQGADSSVELGVKFKSDVNGSITGIRFYKSSANTGTHIGSLWNSAGALIASATFTAETTSGWQQVNFSSPVAIAAGTVYVASYHTTVGHYAEDDNYFATTGFDAAPLHALQDGISGANGAYSYGSTSVFPTQAFLSANYWVDVVFVPGGSFSISGTITNGAGASVALSGSASATVVADSTGNFSFANLANGSYTVTPTKSGFTFSPASQTVTVSGASVSGVSFTATPVFSISGTISPSSLGNASSVTLTQGSTTIATATADSSGNFNFANVVNGSYTVTPSKNGVTFTPSSQNVTVNGANLTSVNFTAAGQTWTISGAITPSANGSGATVTLTQGTTTISTATADISGNFVLANVLNGTYTVTPSKTGFTFTPASQTVTVNSANVTGVNFTAAVITGPSCPCTIWPATAVPALTDQGPDSSVELGVKFKSDAAGMIVGIRFYKSVANTGTHTGSLWSSTGTLLATATFTNETASGWQQVNFSSPVSITANTVYVASYHATVGHYAEDENYFATAGVDNPPLHALAAGVSGFNGAYAYGSSTAFPNLNWFSSNYWVDVVFTVAQTYSLTGNISGAGGSGASVALSGTSTATVTADGSGNYTFTGLANGSYTVTPSKTGYTFTPANAAVTINNANVSGVNFTSAAVPTFNISGTISGAGGNAATVALSGTATANVTADASGNYTFTGLANGSYTVTPSKTGFTFSPASQPVTVNSADVTAVNFTSAAQTYSISGTISGAGGNAATVALSGAATATVTADASGNYSLTGLSNGSYTVTPSKAGFTFTPASQPATVNNANVTALNFSTVSYSISGTISGPGGNAASVALSGAATATVTADASGNYTFTGLVNGSYTVAPSKTGVTFSPASQPVTVSSANVTAVNFSTVTYSISGTISGTGGNAATVALSGAATANVTADASGNYTFTGLVNGAYTVTPSKAGFAFSPTSQPVTVSGADVPGVNFSSATATTFSISGTISGTGGNSATVTLGGAAAATATANASGNYAFTGLVNGSYTVTPSKAGYIFTPVNQAVTVAGTNVAGVNFTSTAQLAIDNTVFTNRSTKSTTLASPAFSTTSANELLLAFVATDGSASAMTVTNVTGAGLTWALVKRTNAQRGTAEIWRALAPATLTSVAVTATLSQSVSASITVMTFTGVDTSGTGGSGAIGATGTGNANPGAPTASLTTTRNNSWVIGVANDWDNAIARTPGANQIVVNPYLATTGDTFWAQRQTSTTPASGTIVTINDTAPTTDRYNLSICEILPAP